MRSHKRDQAAVSVIVPKGGIRGNDGTRVGGLSRSESIASMAPCAIVRCRAMLCLPSRLTGCRLGGLRFSRRLIATSRYARGFSFGVNRAHGLIAPVPYCGLMPCGKPSGLSFPRERSANPHGVSHPLGGRWGISYKLSLGILAMMRTLSRNVSTAFPSIPEPAFLPVQSCHKRAEEQHLYRCGRWRRGPATARSGRIPCGCLPAVRCCSCRASRPCLRLSGRADRFLP